MTETVLAVPQRAQALSVLMSLAFQFAHSFHVRVDDRETGETKTVGMFKTPYCGACTVLDGPAKTAYMVEYCHQTGKVLEQYSREDCKEIYTKRLGLV